MSISSVAKQWTEAGKQYTKAQAETAKDFATQGGALAGYVSRGADAVKRGVENIKDKQFYGHSKAGRKTDRFYKGVQNVTGS